MNNETDFVMTHRGSLWISSELGPPVGELPGSVIPVQQGSPQGLEKLVILADLRRGAQGADQRANRRGSAVAAVDRTTT
jgi:hypothetical protein